MSVDKLVAKIEPENAERTAFLVRAPAVGVLNGVPALGHYANPMEGFATIKVLGHRYTVLLPLGVGGRVAERFIEDTFVPVEYNQPLFRLKQGLDAAEEAAVRGGGGGGEAATDQDLIPVPAPSDGIFYRRASPDTPPYVEEGAEVTTGSVLGLVEVMKSFNQIMYGGPGLPERGTVVRIEAEDSAEVKFGAPLFFIKPKT